MRPRRTGVEVHVPTGDGFGRGRQNCGLGKLGA